jgi:hypothetical protein
MVSDKKIFMGILKIEISSNGQNCYFKPECAQI